MNRTYIKRGVWHLGGRKRQIGGILPILGTIARPLLVSPAGAIGGEVLKGIGKNIFGKKPPKKKNKKILICLETIFCFEDFQGAYRYQTVVYFSRNAKESIGTL